MTKDSVLNRITYIEDEKANAATPIMYIAMVIITLGIVVGAILLIIGIVFSSNYDEFAYIPIITGIAYFLGNLIIYFILKGFAAIITNTHKTSEYARLQAEILADNTYKDIYDDEYENSLPTL